MNILYLGAHAPEHLINKYPQYSLGKYKVSQFIIDGLRRRDDCKEWVITSPDLPSYPALPMYIRRYQDEKLTMVSSLNITVLKQIWTIFTMSWNASKIIRREKIDCVYIPYMVFRHVAVTRILKHLFPRIKICLMVPDIFFLKKGAKGYRMNKWAEKHGVKSDVFVLYTDAMADYLGIRKKPFIVEEGFLDTVYFDRLLAKSRIEVEKKTIVYSGGLIKKYGILRLIESMKWLKDPDVVLRLYGDGDAIEDIKKAAESDNRIRYMGWASKEEIFQALISAAVLVNPRAESDGEFTQYSCPSKILEYLYSGTPTVACPLSGVPSDYYSHLIETDGTPKSLAVAINKALALTPEQREVIGKENREFIKSHVGIERQVGRIVRLLQTSI